MWRRFLLCLRFHLHSFRLNSKEDLRTLYRVMLFFLLTGNCWNACMKDFQPGYPWEKCSSSYRKSTTLRKGFSPKCFSIVWFLVYIEKLFPPFTLNIESIYWRVSLCKVCYCKERVNIKYINIAFLLVSNLFIYKVIIGRVLLQPSRRQERVKEKVGGILNGGFLLVYFMNSSGKNLYYM